MKGLNEVSVHLVHVRRHVALFLNDAGTDLSDMHVDHETIVSVDFEKLIVSEILGIKEVLDIHMLVWQNNVRVSVLVSRSLQVEHAEVFVLLVLVNTKEEVALGGNLLESVTFEGLLLFSRKLVLETGQLNFLLDELVDTGLDTANLRVIRSLGHSKLREEFLAGASVVEHVEVFLVVLVLHHVHSLGSMIKLGRANVMALLKLMGLSLQVSCLSCCHGTVREPSAGSNLG